ncbi:hypothetical protein D7Y11_12560 [Corallococcus sp. AB018]|nr:hypothetical protein D7Y11_12560 [Corallococcus sp. AB018]
MLVAMFIFVIALFLAIGGLLFVGIPSWEQNRYERVRREGQRYLAVIKEVSTSNNDRSQAWLLLKLETPSGPVAKRLIVKFTEAITWEFLSTARVTDRPVYVHCLLDERVGEDVRQFGFVLEEAPVTPVARG